MHIRIVCIGRIKDKYLQMGIAEFIKRIGPYAKLEIVELDEERMPDNPSGADKAKVLEREGERLLKQVKEGSELILLDICGKNLSSEDLAAHFSQLALGGRSDLTFVIGGAFGVSPAIQKTAHLRLSFSRMTFTHQMVRLLLVEQIYRAFKIIKGEPYHW
jgi:23S rRNA (pseudouridine1915-N3)-methyltransferase